MFISLIATRCGGLDAAAGAACFGLHPLHAALSASKPPGATSKQRQGAPKRRTGRA
jgi:hypothetical protein